MKTAISIPDDVFETAERAAKRLGVSRSELFTRAMREYLGACRDASITAAYSEAFADEDDSDDAFRNAATRQTLLRVEWTGR
jgi:metal-responsive CopG/Arc/MetJ family transcriptional regulator